MYKISTTILLLLVAPYWLKSQIFPKEGSSLNYRLIGFEFPSIPEGGTCKLEIAAGVINSEDSFKRKILVSQDCKTNKIIAEVPAFGSQYTWRIISPDNNKQAANIFHHFSTAIIQNVDTSLRRVRIIKKAEAYKNAYFFLDGTRTLYDMSGSPVWFLPNFDNLPNENFDVRDLKLTPQGTVTFIAGEDAYELNYNAEILWKGPNDGKVSGGSSEYYHHKFTRLANGHYMVLAYDFDFWNRLMPSSGDSSFVICNSKTIPSDTSKGHYFSVPFGTIIEYDEKGNVVWAWRSMDYFKGSDIYYHKGRNGKPDLGTHENAFYFDEQAKTIYVSFRNIARIVKIKYPEGNVLAAYGETYEPALPEKGNGLFCHQHSCGVSEKGYLYLFNNNLCNDGMLPTILMMQQPANGKGSLKKIWEYQCTIDGIDDAERAPKYAFIAGGNITELPDHSLFASMCANPYGKVFIVNQDKNILWSALPETKNTATGKWEATIFYEANIIANQSQLEHFIFH